MTVSSALPKIPDRGGPAQPLLTVRGLTKSFGLRMPFGKYSQSFKAVRDISFEVGKGTTLGIVGESGCGKSTCARLIAGITASDSGEVLLDGQEFWTPGATIGREMRRALQMVFQDSSSSLNPKMTIGDTIAFGAKVHGMPRREAEVLAQELLSKVGLAPHEYLHRLPHQLSGGQRQRVNIARAIAVGPRLLILDEPVSALDKAVEAQVLDLLLGLKKEADLTYIFISHDLNVIRFIADEVAVMYLGEIVEMGPVADVFSRPSHPYTQALLASRLSLDPADRPTSAPLRGEPPALGEKMAGCPFRTRCDRSADVCAERAPMLESVSTMMPRHQVSCWIANDGAARRGQVGGKGV